MIPPTISPCIKIARGISPGFFFQEFHQEFSLELLHNFHKTERPVLGSLQVCLQRNYIKIAIPVEVFYSFGQDSSIPRLPQEFLRRFTQSFCWIISENIVEFPSGSYSRGLHWRISAEIIRWNFPRSSKNT